VIGMTPTIMERLLPYLSVYQESGDLDIEGEGRRGVAEAWQFGASGRVMVVAVVARAEERSGATFTRKIVARLRADPGLDQAPYQILTWDRLGQ
jgi:6-phosphogluconate dehydrogenase (decarboxylating)